MGQTFSAVTQETMRLASRDVCDDLTWSNTWANRSTLSVPEQLQLLDRQEQTGKHHTTHSTHLEDRLWMPTLGYGENKEKRKANVVMPLYPEPAVIAEQAHSRKNERLSRDEDGNEMMARAERRQEQRKGHRRRRSSKEVVFMDRVVVFQLKDDDRRCSLDSDNDSDDSV